MPALTAWQTVVTHAQVAAGQRVLVLGAAGGVEHLAVQIAAGGGAHVIATASSRSHDFVRGLGASEIVDYTHERVEAVVKDADVIVDPVGGETAIGLLAALRPGGVLVTLKGKNSRLEATAADLGVRVAYTYVAPDGAIMGNVSEWLDDGRLRVEIQQVLPLGTRPTLWNRTRLPGDSGVRDGGGWGGVPWGTASALPKRLRPCSPRRGQPGPGSPGPAGKRSGADTRGCSSTLTGTHGRCCTTPPGRCAKTAR